VFAVSDSGKILHYDGSSWSLMTCVSKVELTGVWGSSASDVFAVGYNDKNLGVILHYDGSSWSIMTVDTIRVNFAGVWGSSASDVFAVGAYKLGKSIMHYDGSSWLLMTNGINAALSGVWGSSASDVFAVGWNGMILHYGDYARVSRRGGFGNSV
jgi:hypothetical protein